MSGNVPKRSADRVTITVIIVAGAYPHVHCELRGDYYGVFPQPALVMGLQSNRKATC